MALIKYINKTRKKGKQLISKVAFSIYKQQLGSAKAVRWLIYANIHVTHIYIKYTEYGKTHVYLDNTLPFSHKDFRLTLSVDNTHS